MVTPQVHPSEPEIHCTAFAAGRRIASGAIGEVAATAKRFADGDTAQVLVFDDSTGRLVDLDLRGTVADVVARLAAPNTRGPGRPRLGVVAREVTLLPRHWEWLNSQPGGASVALRKLVDAARSTNAAADRIRQAKEATYRFITAMAGDEPGYEEAIRSLYADDRKRFESLVGGSAKDIATHAARLAANGWKTLSG